MSQEIYCVEMIIIWLLKFGEYESYLVLGKEGSEGVLWGCFSQEI